MQPQWQSSLIQIQDAGSRPQLEVQEQFLTRAEVTLIKMEPFAIPNAETDIMVLVQSAGSIAHPVTMMTGLYVGRIL